MYTCRPNSTIHLDFEEFATECNWDHLYIYDGKSVQSPLIAVIRYEIVIKSVATSAVVSSVIHVDCLPGIQIMLIIE